jgi:hypothetical protein
MIGNLPMLVLFHWFAADDTRSHVIGFTAFMIGGVRKYDSF